MLVISGTDRIQGHTETLWKLLEQYRIPTFLFINKMDRPGTDARSLLLELRHRLHGGCIDFGRPEGDELFYEDAALTDEDVMEDFLLTGRVEDAVIVRLIRERKIFPCYFGSALKLEGIRELLAGLEAYTEEKTYPAEFGARVFKIARDEQGTRLTYLKVTGGSLRVKTMLEGRNWQEKADSSCASIPVSGIRRRRRWLRARSVRSPVCRPPCREKGWASSRRGKSPG